MCSPTESSGIQEVGNNLFKSLESWTKRIVSVVMTGVLACSLVSCARGDIILTTEFEEGEIMRINNLSCFMPEMMLYLTNMQNEYEEVYGSEIWAKSLNGEMLSDNIKDIVLARVAQIKVMNLMAVEYEITLSEEENRKIDEAADKYLESLSDREKELLGATKEVVKQVYTEYVLAGRVYDYIIRDINPEISDDEARTITVQHILIKTYYLDGNGNRVSYSERARGEAYEKALEVKALADPPEPEKDEETGEYLAEPVEPVDFELLAAEYNEDEETTYSFVRGEMAEAFEEAAFSLDNGEISDVIETEYGYHIIKCISTFDVDETQENKVKILKERKDKVFEETYEDYVVGIKKNLNTGLYDSIALIDDPAVKTKDMFSDEYLGGL